MALGHDELAPHLLAAVIDGQIAGAIGVSGGTSQQDGECAKAGVGAVS